MTTLERRRKQVATGCAEATAFVHVKDNDISNNTTYHSEVKVVFLKHPCKGLDLPLTCYLIGGTVCGSRRDSDKA